MIYDTSELWRYCIGRYDTTGVEKKPVKGYKMLFLLWILGVTPFELYTTYLYL